ncbi:MAG: putative sprt family metallopeptidase [Streblomastix strix]|uniref:Putative sprt family metallopeptidase n=1 Tax=Streblomastix strix TaxID=222440 RepID=A0A5J4WFS3_9EUKA|nr:MAG: putative sprt family metallopeptidase [Streblomastix strix]
MDTSVNEKQFDYISKLCDKYNFMTSVQEFIGFIKNGAKLSQQTEQFISHYNESPPSPQLIPILKINTEDNLKTPINKAHHKDSNNQKRKLDSTLHNKNSINQQNKIKTPISLNKSSFKTPTSKLKAQKTPKITSPQPHNTISRSPFQYTAIQFARKKIQLAHHIYDFVNSKVFENRLPNNLAIDWAKRLKTTAGQAHITRKRLIEKLPNGEKIIKSESTIYRIELSSHVVDRYGRLLRTLSHEMCHVAQWVLSGTTKERAHGKTFKKWAKLCEKRAGIQVSTKHNYEINYKYRWKCQNCGELYQRHSRSIDPETVCCGVCHGKLEAVPNEQ